MMVRWMCGVSLRIGREVRSCTVFWVFKAWLRRGRLRWFGHVERKSEHDWVKFGCGRGEMCGQGQEDLKRMCKR